VNNIWLWELKYGELKRGLGKRGEHNRKRKLTLERAVLNLKRRENKNHISKSVLAYECFATYTVCASVPQRNYLHFIYLA
jgi:hypothetical protein